MQSGFVFFKMSQGGFYIKFSSSRFIHLLQPKLKTRNRKTGHKNVLDMCCTFDLYATSNLWKIICQQYIISKVESHFRNRRSMNSGQISFPATFLLVLPTDKILINRFVIIDTTFFYIYIYISRSSGLIGVVKRVALYSLLLILFKRWMHCKNIMFSQWRDNFKLFANKLFIF